MSSVLSSNPTAQQTAALSQKVAEFKTSLDQFIGSQFGLENFVNNADFMTNPLSQEFVQVYMQIQNQTTSLLSNQAGSSSSFSAVIPELFSQLVVLVKEASNRAVAENTETGKISEW